MVFPEKTGSLELLRYCRDHFGIYIQGCLEHQEKLLSEFKAQMPGTFNYDLLLDVFVAESMNPGIDHSVTCARDGKPSLMMSMFNPSYDKWMKTIPVLMEYGYDVLVITSDHCYYSPGKCFSVILTETDRSPKTPEDVYMIAQRRIHYKEAS